MVLNEAAAGGLPLVATEGSGAARDLIEEGVNGFRVPAGDVAVLARAAHAARRRTRRFARAPARARASWSRGFTPEAWADGVAGLAEPSSARPRDLVDVHPLRRADLVPGPRADRARVSSVPIMRAPTVRELPLTRLSREKTIAWVIP